MILISLDSFDSYFHRFSNRSNRRSYESRIMFFVVRAQQATNGHLGPLPWPCKSMQCTFNFFKNTFIPKSFIFPFKHLYFEYSLFHNDFHEFLVNQYGFWSILSLSVSVSLIHPCYPFSIVYFLDLRF